MAITSRARISSSSSSVPSSITPRRRISHGSVRPCPTTVTRISAKVMNWISSRPGSGSPASVLRGSASAAASETAPRIPAQLPTTRKRQLARRARCDSRRSSVRTRKVTMKFHRKRAAITVAQTAAA